MSAANTFKEWVVKEFPYGLSEEDMEWGEQVWNAALKNNTIIAPCGEALDPARHCFMCLKKHSCDKALVGTTQY